MKPTEVKRFKPLYRCHLKSFKLQGKSKSTIDAYSRTVRRVFSYFDCWQDRLTQEQLEDYFLQLVENHSWRTIKLNRLGLKFFWKDVAKIEWQWLNNIKTPKIYDYTGYSYPCRNRMTHWGHQ